MHEVKKPRKPLIYYYVIVLMVLVLFNFLFMPWVAERQIKEVGYEKFMQMTEEEDIGRVEIDQEENQITFSDKDETAIYKTGMVDDPDLTERLYDAGAEFSGQIIEQTSPWVVFLLNWILPILIFVGIGQYMSKKMMDRAGGKNSMMFGMGKSNAKVYVKSSKGIRFSDVAGEDEAKENLAEIVDYLHDPKKYKDIGASMPKGILLVGPPGTGKTMLAKAVAGEANVPFFSMSGSEFVEMFVGMGASKVRDLFKQAKEKAPCIVFIDEIDAIGKKRDGNVGGNDEREQTLNQLLVEMDGFSANEGVIVLAATNRVDILDPALLRPGRFDRQVYVGYPDIKGREAILKIHARNKPLADDVSLAELAKATGGFTGADLENLMNEAALLAARREERFITMEDLHEAVIKVIAGPEKKSKVVTPRERRLTAYHEAGHAVVNHSLETADPVHQITIVPRGGAGGMTISLPQEDKNFLSRTELTERIASLLGGRVAEQLTLGDISTGAGNDIQRASSIARNMVMRYGMSDRLGSVTFDTGHDEVFIGRSMAQAKSYSEEVAGIIDEEVKTLIDNAYARCESILKAHAKELDLVARYLLEHETMDAKTFEQVFTDPASLQAQLPADGDGDSASDPWPEPGNGDA